MEKVQRLRTACKKTRHLFENEELTRELHAGTDIARRWTVITAAYSGLEQTLKYLIAEEKDFSILELIHYVPSDKLQGNYPSNRRYPYRTHNIAWLYDNLEESTQSIVQEFYARFQSLHDYIPICIASEFLERISGQDGEGYERWRYALIEERDLPQNSAEALLAIWDVCVGAAEERISEAPGVRMPNETLDWSLRRQLKLIVNKVSVERQNQGEPFQDIQLEIRAWFQKAGCSLNAFAQALWYFKRYNSHGVVGASDWFSNALDRWLNDALASPAITGPTSFREFANRAQGNTPHGASIRWNTETNRFDSIPWPLDALNQVEAPPNPIVTEDFDWGRWLLSELWMLARENGYEVLENRQHNALYPQKGWFRSLQVRNGATAEAVPVLSVWESPSDLRFSIVQECSNEIISPNLRSWLSVIGQSIEANRA